MRTSVELNLRLPSRAVVPARVITFRDLADGGEHVAVALGEQVAARRAGRPPLVRMHSECLTGDVLCSARCDCGPQLREALEALHREGGYLLYLRQEGRGIGLYSKIDAYALQDDGLDTFAANRALGFADDERDYEVAAQMLQALGVGAVELLTNNRTKTRALESFGISVVRQRPTGVFETPENSRYLAAKAEAGRG
ncbi:MULTISPECIES: GTP cyclohydrolase II [unclassified Nocardioides]|uniref:GTP cyclohydrolase II n=1 Tax=Nocardioides sp. URHA0032 TaxID=1380388 RepID=UPI00048BB26C|nr:GTP cyclohydrolase II [Nocardioides sp. URHA0032]